MSVFSITPPLPTSEESLSMEDIIDLFIEDHAANKDEQFNSLCAMSTALEVLDFESQIKFLDTLAQHDDSVRQIIGFDDNQYLANFKQQIDIAEEGFWQDLFTYGLFGSLIGLYLSSLNRIETCCKEGIQHGFNQNSLERGFGTNSIYILNSKTFFELTKALQILYSMIQESGKNIQTFDPMKQANKLKSLGIEITSHSVKGGVKFKWGSAIGGTIGRILMGIALGAGGGVLGVIGSQVGSTTGSLIGAALGGPNGAKNLSELGWNSSNCKEACKLMLKLVEQAKSLDKASSDVKEAANKSKKDVADKVIFLQQAAKIYLKNVKEIGRGLCAMTKFTLIR